MKYNNKEIDKKDEFVKKCPFLIMTNLYQLPGSGDELVNRAKNQPETSFMLEVQLAYFRGEIEKVYQLIQAASPHEGSFEYQISEGMLLSLCAMYRGDNFLWQNAKKYMMSISSKNPKEQQQLAFWLAATDSCIFDASNFPEWFQRGCFDNLPEDTYALARYFYVKYLYLVCEESLSTDKNENSHYLVLMKMLSAVCEPLITQTKLEKAILPEIYLRIICAIGYHTIGNDSLAILHLDQAIELALPDRLYEPFVEYRRAFDYLMDERLKKADLNALKKVRALNKELLAGWVKLHNKILERTISNDLTTREREIARLAVYGFTNAQIAQQLHISLNTVKQSLRKAMNKTGCKKRMDMIKYL